ncbi:septal ring lytic transglycosylase RlpA family protein [Phenylobacterium sp.]|uniref:septal ring lytic transglycosylase RlpA family protein n=1 Tax=Phenylobacterium sp. TaxID=1871053 RepID=UPI00272EF28A|nr:septal ring lytic transglycosylase RlpA family protein [Phenylobacterium sp.]MDP1618457.1 septal ring lytic transglycosylase RlpA family protein [Phenylobacterium sp.]MDP1988050.1 septal ring lytic transglycosylase RlpA family protein [Phenylobacterium sp.]
MGLVRGMDVRAVRGLVAVSLGALALTACAAPKPKLSNRLPDAGASQGGKAAPGAGGTYKVGKPYQVGGVWYVPREDPSYNKVGTASWYGAQFHSKATANGERFDMNAMTAAHTTLPLPSLVEVTNLENGRKVTVRVNDRGPFVGDRIIDLSRAAARELGFESQGLAKVRVRYVGRAPLGGGGDLGVRTAQAEPAPTPQAPIPYTQLAQATPPPAPAPAPAVSLPPIEPEPVYSAPEPPPPWSNYRVQAGAFGDRANADRAVSMLAHAGQVVVEPTGGGFYRVILEAGADERQAWAIRDQAARAGFPDARVIHPY